MQLEANRWNVWRMLLSRKFACHPSTVKTVVKCQMSNVSTLRLRNLNAQSASAQKGVEMKIAWRAHGEMRTVSKKTGNPLLAGEITSYFFNDSRSLSCQRTVQAAPARHCALRPVRPLRLLRPLRPLRPQLIQLIVKLCSVRKCELCNCDCARKICLWRF